MTIGYPHLRASLATLHLAAPRAHFCPSIAHTLQTMCQSQAGVWVRPRTVVEMRARSERRTYTTRASRSSAVLL